MKSEMKNHKQKRSSMGKYLQSYQKGLSTTQQIKFMDIKTKEIRFSGNNEKVKGEIGGNLRASAHLQ